MKVLFVPPMSYPLHMGGFESQVLHIFNELRLQGIDVHWFDLKSTEIRDYDIIHFHSSVTEFVSVAMKARDLGKKIVVTTMVGSPRYSNNSYKFKLLMSRIPGFFYVYKKINQLYNYADGFIVLTNFEKNRLENVFNVKRKVSVIPNGIDDSYFLTQKIDNLNIPVTNYILVVGRIEPDKNQLSLIEAAKQLNFNILIVGDPGTGMHDYFNICKEYGGENVYFWGRENDPSKMKVIYEKAALTAIPSKTEMLPLVIYESLSQGTPVLCTTNCGLYPELVEGVFYTAPTKEAILTNLKEIWPKLPTVKVGRQGIYKWKEIADKHIVLYNELMNIK